MSLSGVFHITVDKAGDAWVTSTLQGPAQLVPTDPTLPTYTGHAVTWFGQSSNNKNNVQHDTFNVQVAAGSTSLGFHMVDHARTNADGTITVAFSNLTCS